MRPTLSYCGQEVHTHDYDRFLLSLFVPQASREPLLALYALNAELAHVRAMVSEEMIGHIRYAWWVESLEKLASGTQPRGHPLLETLAQEVASGRVPLSLLMPLAEHYRDHFPGAPPQADDIVEQSGLTLIRSLCPQSERPWMKAQGIISRHRLLHSGRRNGWLSVKLLLAGLF